MSYALAIRRACERAGVPHWAPNQLRHARATELRKTYGLDAAGAVLGHAKLETTQIYAEKNAELAAKVAKATG
jgi:site-specific recombinase XerD